MRHLVGLFLLAAASAASAQTLTGKQFDTLSRGTTMHFSQNGQDFGSEQFFSGQRTAWRAQNGRCINGKWTYEPPAICFTYDDGSGPFCWLVAGNAENLTITSTRNRDGGPPLVLQLSGQDKTQIICTGPLFGVAFQP